MPGWAFVLLIPMGIVFFLAVSYVIATGGTLPITQGALFVPTPGVRVRAFLEAVSIGPGETVVDLGCGDGRVLRAVRKRYGAEVLGYEVNPFAYLMGRLLAFGRPGVNIRFGNFWKADLSGAQVVFCYLFPDVMSKMSAKLKAELAPGARVVSCNFPLPGWRPERVLHPDSASHGDPIYVYLFPDAVSAMGGEGG